MKDDITDAINKFKSGIIKITFYKNSERVSSGSGFLCKNRIISNNHVFFDPDGNPLTGTVINIRFGDTPFNDKDPIEVSYEDFMRKLEVGSTKENFDYAVFNFEGIDYSERYSFDLGDHTDVKDGCRILAMGYPFGENNLTSHVGYVSSIYNNGRLDVIQLDISANNGNSGGPVIDLITHKTIGIVTKKQDGLERQFDDLLRSFDENIKFFESLKQNGSIRLMGIDPINYMQISQNQMKVISVNIKRSANTGIGYAFSCSKLQEENFYVKS